MGESTRVFALLGDAELRRAAQQRWRANGIQLCAVHGEGASEALAAEVGRLHPDVLIADSDVDGVHTVVEIATRRHHIPVIMLVRAQQNSLAALQPLDWGAVTLIPRDGLPNSERDDEELFAVLEHDVRAVGQAQVVELLESHFPLSGAFPDASVFDKRRALRAVQPQDKLLVIAGGIGAPMAVRRILCKLRQQVSSPIVYAQRLAEPLLGTLAMWLQSHTGLNVLRARDAMPLEVNHVYVCAPEQESVRVALVGEQATLKIAGRASAPASAGLNGLLASLAASYGKRALAVVLSGHGSDGCDGMLSVRNAGGFTIVQDRASSILHELPGRVREHGGAIECLPINEIAERIHMLMLPTEISRS